MEENSVNPGEYAFQPGQIVGDWKVVRPLGKGGMAEVFEVEGRRLGARYALKLFTYARGEKETARARFFAEGRLLARLDHPRLVRVYDLAEDGQTGRPYFVMDLVLDPEGKPCTLAEVATADEEQVARWYEDLRDGLDYIHDRGILHRDLKLQNVLVGSDGHAVLSDFGVAKIFDPGLRTDLGLSAEQTLVAARGGQKTVMGSVGYMAPEVEMGVAASKQSDWYALGVIVFRLLTGVWCDSRTDVQSHLETYNPIWLDILPKLLHSNPAGRECPSWTELERARRDEEAFQSERLYTEAREKLRRAKRAKKWLVVALAVVLASVGLGGAGLFAWRSMFHLPPFEELCAIPANLPPQLDADEDESPRAAYELAQVDAWLVTHDLLREVAQGRRTRASAVERVRHLARLAADDDDAVFAGHGDYEGAGEAEILARLLGDMADRMEGKAVK